MPYVRDDVQNVLNLLAAQPGPQMHEVDPATARQMMAAMAGLMDRPSPAGVAKTDLSIQGPGGPLKLRRYVPANAEAGKLLLFFHGGGWVIGDLETHDGACGSIAELLGWQVVAVDYRLAPEAVFPAATEDCLAAARWAAGSPAELGQVDAIVVCGDSAGGNLAAVVARELGAEGKIAAQWLIYPGVDMNAVEGSMQEFAEGYLLTGAGMLWFMDHYKPQPGHEWASPLHAEAWDGLPPALVFTCGLDPLRDQGRAYAARLAATGHRVIFREAAGQVHGSLNIRGAVPSAQADLEAQVRDLKALLS